MLLYRRGVKWVSAILLVLVASSCGSSSNGQSQPIGSRCKSNGNCGSSPFTCELTGYPGGYCDKPCSTDGDCPIDSLCVPAKGCRRRCGDMGDQCRTDSAEGVGYGCISSAGTTGSFCDVIPASSSVDGGSPSG